MKALIIKGAWLKKYYEGQKIWEIRSKATHIRGRVYFMESGTGGRITGEATLVTCVKLTLESFKTHVKEHGIQDEAFVKDYKGIYAWIFKNIKQYDVPKVYKPKRGAIVWVNVEEEEEPWTC